jgi:hypothetical protein
MNSVNWIVTDCFIIFAGNEYKTMLRTCRNINFKQALETIIVKVDSGFQARFDRYTQRKDDPIKLQKRNVKFFWM